MAGPTKAQLAILRTYPKCRYCSKRIKPDEERYALPCLYPGCGRELMFHTVHRIDSVRELHTWLAERHIAAH